MGERVYERKEKEKKSKMKYKVSQNFTTGFTFNPLE